jgi:hypothetical protein
MNTNPSTPPASEVSLRHAPATAGQKRRLLEHNVPFDDATITLSEAASLIHAAIGPKYDPSHPATPGQLEQLRARGIVFEPSITTLEASHLLASSGSTGHLNVLEVNPALARRLEARGEDVKDLTYSAAAKLEATLNAAPPSEQGLPF